MPFQVIGEHAEEDVDANSATSYLATMDANGTVFSGIPSDNSLSGLIVPGTGIITSMWGARAYTDPDHPSCVAPEKRPRMSSNPAMAIRNGKMVMAFGSPGAEILVQAMLQVFLNVIAFGMDTQSAVEAPRFGSYSWPATEIPHTYYPGRLNLEANLGRDVGEALAALGHNIEWWPERKWAAGSVCAIVSDLEYGIKWGAADFRRTAYAIG